MRLKNYFIIAALTFFTYTMSAQSEAGITDSELVVDTNGTTTLKLTYVFEGENFKATSHRITVVNSSIFVESFYCKQTSPEQKPANQMTFSLPDIDEGDYVIVGSVYVAEENNCEDFYEEDLYTSTLSGKKTNLIATL